MCCVLAWPLVDELHSQGPGHILIHTLHSTANPNFGDVRLLGDPRDGVGAVEYYDTQLGWTGICADSAHSFSWNSNTAAASIVCTQLGYEGGRPYSQRYMIMLIDLSSIFSLPLSLPSSLFPALAPSLTAVLQRLSVLQALISCSLPVKEKLCSVNPMQGSAGWSVTRLVSRHAERV